MEPNVQKVHDLIKKYLAMRPKEAMKNVEEFFETVSEDGNFAYFRDGAVAIFNSKLDMVIKGIILTNAMDVAYRGSKIGIKNNQEMVEYLNKWFNIPIPTYDFSKPISIIHKEKETSFF